MLRNKWGRLLLRVAKDERGMESVEVALSIALIAALAGIGMIVLGQGLQAYFEDAGTEISGFSFPSLPNPTTPPAT
jgi:Flp pilus assembly pilin Flp